MASHPAAWPIIWRSACCRPLALAVALLAGTIALGSVAAAPNPVSGAKKDEFQSSAPHAMLMDAESGTILFEKNPDQLMAPSSLAKLMTAEVVFNEIKQGRLALDKEFIVSEDAWRRGGAPSHTSSMFAPIHSRARVQDLLYGMIVQSASPNTSSRPIRSSIRCTARRSSPGTRSAS